MPGGAPDRENGHAADGITAQLGVKAFGVAGRTGVFDIVGHDPANPDVSALALIDDLVQKGVLAEGSAHDRLKTKCGEDLGRKGVKLQIALGRDGRGEWLRDLADQLIRVERAHTARIVKKQRLRCLQRGVLCSGRGQGKASRRQQKGQHARLELAPLLQMHQERNSVRKPRSANTQTEHSAVPVLQKPSHAWTWAPDVQEIGTAVPSSYALSHCFHPP